MNQLLNPPSLQRLRTFRILLYKYFKLELEKIFPFPVSFSKLKIWNEKLKISLAEENSLWTRMNWILLSRLKRRILFSYLQPPLPTYPGFDMNLKRFLPGFQRNKLRNNGHILSGTFCKFSCEFFFINILMLLCVLWNIKLSMLAS